MAEALNRRWTWWVGLAVLLLLAGFRLWMTDGQEFLARVRPHDDSLFLALATSILEGRWLGEFHHHTLIKGPGYPLFIAFAHRLGIPLLLAQQMLYVLACTAVLLALLPLSRSRLAACLAFVLLLFNPAAFNDPVVVAAFRESFYLSLGLLFTACLIGLGTGDGRLTPRNLAWALVLGVAGSWLWITREESIWVVPGILFMGALFLPPWPWQRESRWTSRVVLVLLPALMVTATLAGIRRANDVHYRVPHVVEIKSPEFISALGSLMNIRQDGFLVGMVVSPDAVIRGAEVSPALAELAPSILDTRYPPQFFIWTLRAAARDAGYYDDPADGSRALDLYRRVGEEITSACASGALSCLDRSPTLQPPWLPEHWQFLPDSLASVAGRAIGFNQFNAYSMRQLTRAREPFLSYVEELTGEHPERRTHHMQPELSAEYLAAREQREYLMKRFINVYLYLAPLLFLVALVVHGKRIFSMLRTRRYEPGTVAALLPFGYVLTLILMLTYVLVTIWPVGRPLHTVYPLVLLYAGMVLAGRPPAQSSLDS